MSSDELRFERKLLLNAYVELVELWEAVLNTADRRLSAIQDQVERLEDSLDIPEEEERRGRRP